MSNSEKVIGKIDNREVISYELINHNGFQVNVLNYGGIITHILAPDKNGNFENVVLSYKELSLYETNPSYYGALIGRTAGRICGGKAVLDGKEVQFFKNNGFNSLHGGDRGFNKKFWDCSWVGSNALRLKHFSPDGEENYPGNLETEVEYLITDNNELVISYYAKSDKKTLVNLTNHSYFNLSGDVREGILDHVLRVDASYIVELDETMAATGNLIPVENTPFDFRNEKKIGRDIDENHPQLKVGAGYDHPWLFNPGEGPKVCMYHEATGRGMEVYTDQKYAVMYTTNYPDGELLSNGKAVRLRDGVCFETQGPPIGRDNAFIEGVVLNANQEYRRKTIFRFYVK